MTRPHADKKREQNAEPRNIPADNSHKSAALEKIKKWRRVIIFRSARGKSCRRERRRRKEDYVLKINAGQKSNPESRFSFWVRGSVGG